MGINWTIENKRWFTLFYFSSIRGMFLTQKEKRKHDLTLFHHLVFFDFSIFQLFISIVIFFVRDKLR